jgi:hypothetical protein
MIQMFFGPPGSASGSISHGSGSGSFYHQAKILRLLYDFLSLKNDVNVPSKSNKQKNFFVHILKIMKITDDPDPHPDPLVRGMDPRIRIHIRVRTKFQVDPQHWFWKVY